MQQLPGSQSRAFVPTMGSLHAGHIALVSQAKQTARQTVASIFVNRLQFLPTEDFAAYPRTFESDCEKLEAAQCDVLFAPMEAELYPQTQVYKVAPPTALADMLEGEFRPGFYTGVCTVVMKLFQCVQPSHAVFGKKDYQQLAIIKHMVQQFAMPIQIISGVTVRETDGLAMSSRNAYLTAQERHEATLLASLMNASAQTISAQSLNASALRSLEADAINRLYRAGWVPDYFAVRNQSDLMPAQGSATHHPRSGPKDPDIRNDLVILAAAKLGKTRLIDQLEINCRSLV